MEETRLFPEQSWEARLAELTERHNEAFEREDHEAAAAVRADLFEAIEQQRPTRGTQGVELHIKTSRNELIRSYLARGWYDEALEQTQAALEPLSIDATCPNRPAVVLQAHGRALLEAGRLDEGQAVLEQALASSTAFLALIEEGWRKEPGELLPRREAGAPEIPSAPPGELRGPPPGAAPAPHPER